MTFLVNGISYKLVTLSSGTASATITGLPAGSNTVDASYSGDNNYAASSGVTQTIVVMLAPTATTFTSSISSGTPVPPSSSVTLTATVLSAVISAKPTGTVNFVGNGGVLASAAVNASTGIATVTTTALPAGVYTIAATYVGDSGFATSTSAPIGISIRPQQFDIGNARQHSAISAPGSTSTSFSLVPISGYVGGIDMACSGLPANTQCTFLPATVAFNGAPAAQTVQLTVVTNTPASYYRSFVDGSFWSAPAYRHMAQTQGVEHC